MLSASLNGSVRLFHLLSEGVQEVPDLPALLRGLFFGIAHIALQDGLRPGGGPGDGEVVELPAEELEIGIIQ